MEPLQTGKLLNHVDLISNFYSNSPYHLSEVYNPLPTYLLPACHDLQYFYKSKQAATQGDPVPTAQQSVCRLPYTTTLSSPTACLHHTRWFKVPQTCQIGS